MSDPSVSPSPERPKAIWWRFIFGVALFPAIGGIALYGCMIVYAIVSFVLAGQGAFVGSEGWWEFFAMVFLSAIFATGFGLPVGVIFAGIGHVFTRRSPAAGAGLAAIAGSIAFYACVVSLGGGTVDEAEPVLGWILAVIPLSAILGWVFCRWVYRVQKETLIDTFA